MTQGNGDSKQVEDRSVQVLPMNVQKIANFIETNAFKRLHAQIGF